MSSLTLAKLILPVLYLLSAYVWFHYGQLTKRKEGELIAQWLIAIVGVTVPTILVSIGVFLGIQ